MSDIANHPFSTTIFPAALKVSVFFDVGSELLFCVSKQPVRVAQSPLSGTNLPTLVTTRARFDPSRLAILLFQP